MAHMYPEKLPTTVKSRAERDLFHLLEDKRNLPDDYTVIWSKAWTIGRPIDKGNGVQDGEIDFLVLHPLKGILIIEAKGGGVHYNETSREWYSVDYYDVEHKIKDPFEQVTVGKNSLRKHLLEQSSSPLLRVRCRTCGFGQAVIFPDLSEEQAIDIADRAMRDRDIVISSQGVQANARKKNIDQVFDRSRRNIDRPLGIDAVNEFVNRYATSWRVRPLLINCFKQEKQHLAQLTEQQFKLLDWLNSHKRVAIHGFAGSGKTFLAVEKARRLAHLGKAVLFTCYNHDLAVSLQRQITDESRADVTLRSIQVYNIHALAKDLCRKLKIWPSRNYFGQSEPEFYIEKLVDAAKRTSLRYDAIIVDEGQDFEDGWWEGLQILLRSKESSFYIFYDDNQNIFNRTSNYPIPPEHIELYENCRTTKKIHEEIIKYYFKESGLAPTCEGPVGREIECISISSNENAPAELAKILNRLNREGISLQDIVLLTPSSQKKSFYQDGLLIDRQIRLNWNLGNTDNQNALTCHSIHKFKGLESDVVILVEMDKAERMPDKQKVLYVALSRARLHLIIIEDKRAIERLSYLPDFPDEDTWSIF